MYGVATVGTKGQVVIPSSAREELGIEAGDRLYVIGSVNGCFIGLLQEEALESMMEALTAQMESFRAIKERQTRSKD